LIVARGIRQRSVLLSTTRRFGPQRQRARRHVARKRDQMRVCVCVRCVARFSCCLSLRRGRASQRVPLPTAALSHFLHMHARAPHALVKYVFFWTGGIIMEYEWFLSATDKANIAQYRCGNRRRKTMTTRLLRSLLPLNWVSFDTTEVCCVCSVRCGSMQPTSSPALLRPMLSRSPASYALSRSTHKHTHTHTHSLHMSYTYSLPRALSAAAREMQRLPVYTLSHYLNQTPKL
jgi:hypothetical protein